MSGQPAAAQTRQAPQHAAFGSRAAETLLTQSWATCCPGLPAAAATAAAAAASAAAAAAAAMASAAAATRALCTAPPWASRPGGASAGAPLKSWRQRMWGGLTEWMCCAAARSLLRMHSRCIAGGIQCLTRSCLACARCLPHDAPQLYWLHCMLPPASLAPYSLPRVWWL